MNKKFKHIKSLNQRKIHFNICNKKQYKTDRQKQT